MILGFLFFIQTFLKHCKALSTEKYKCYMNVLLLLLLLLLETKVGTTSQDSIMHSKNRRVWLSETPLIPYKPLVPRIFLTKSYKNRAEKLWQPQTGIISSQDFFKNKVLEPGHASLMMNQQGCAKVTFALANGQPKNPYVPPGINKAVLYYMPCTMTFSNCQSILMKTPVSLSLFLCLFGIADTNALNGTTTELSNTSVDGHLIF